MNKIIENQAYVFCIYVICGFIIGIFFDLFRILRKSFKTSDFITFLEDVAFGIITGLFLIFMLFVFNSGELRFYIFFSLILGNIIYLCTISKPFIKINVLIITTLKKIISQILKIAFWPIMFIIKKIFKLLLKPFGIFTINIKKINLSNIFKYNKKAKKNKKFLQEKKDFNI